MPSPSSPSILRTPLETLKILLKSFSDQLSNLTPNKTSILDPPNALALLHDSASILRAQSTKLSLLLLNKPFTPSAIASILTSISGECLPGLMSVYEICSPDIYGNLIQNDVRNQLRDLVAAITPLVEDIGGMTESMDVNLSEKREEILHLTGQVWNACDRMLETAKVGVVGVAMAKAKAWEALIKDAIDELEKWDPDAEDDFDMDIDSEGEKADDNKTDQNEGINSVPKNKVEQPGNDKGHEEDKRGFQSIGAQPPSNTTDIHTTKANVLKLLKLIKMLYPALRKRRISAYPPFTRLDPVSSLHPRHQVKRFGDMLAFCEDFSTATDDLADALYDGAPQLVHAKMESMTTMACMCVDGVKQGWSGEEDEFTAWSGKWIARVKEVVGVRSKKEEELSQQYHGMRLD
ncbi:MAG: hypothetical protein Q9226_000984 [Calogaya cf. arnoldii]